ncbi:M20/M25/M40 family metallo-hydrolase [Solimonas marina]|uniref:M20/M25/M40 family metallo-hydrolase n=1 Tax=Solimonas marina TaxID=2714601 RepID=A0A969W5C9_9GAMM|nr:M20/M25/M40 family metallo-hydrolase [Solimonas marina]NKF20882.1 M20/M25/M40 family metallo-hydrolase [Solimonas marina]
MIKKLAVSGALPLLILAAGCSHPAQHAAAPAPTAPTAAAAKADPQRMMDTVKTLSSEAFEGRFPGTDGEKVTVDYLIQQFKAMGLQPGGANGQYTQQVPLLNTQIGKGTMFVSTAAGATLPLTEGQTVALTTGRPDPRIKIDHAPLVFVGYGVDAPDIGWDDFKGVDLHGKVVILLVNDPDYAAQPGDDAVGKFGGKRMTYYGRWTYKFAEAARRGAAAALIIHDPKAAGYGWNVASAHQGKSSDIVRAPGEEGLPVEGWLQHDEANALFKAAGLDLDHLRVEARSTAFHPVVLKGLSLSADLPVTSSTVQSQNVLARLPGKTHPDETVIYGAHWDTLGRGTPDAQGRTLRPGANDDGLGTAAVLELARLFTQTHRQPDRSVVFALWTAEESGLLGSEYYATHPIYPIAKTVADLNIDIMQTAGPAKNLVEVGMGNSSLDALMQQAAAAQNRTVEPETYVEQGLFYRADHLSLAMRGVPSLLIMGLGGAPDLVSGGKADGQKWLDGYMKCYHQTCDAMTPDWDLRGAAQDIDVFYAIGQQLANSREWPTWNAGVAFKKTREATADQRQP